ncbi:energy transducer TonB [Sulfurovum sp.]|uniref:energy transducer TonB n=1 Tax=Sulfurovum sp. TaxID=1969726 RepID=UPI002867C59D|nr:energy transducer TonB [Sulfurovum sp.]
MFAAKNMKRKRDRAAVLAMLLGAVLMMILVVSFNKDVKKKEEVKKDPLRYMKIERVKQDVQKPKPKPKPKKKSTPKAPLPDLSSMMGGIEMDIPEFDLGNIAGNPNDLLGDIARNAAMSEGTADTKPRVLSRSPMQYPESAMKKRIKGYVVVNLLIDVDGSIEAAKILQSSPPGVFDAAALSGIRSWRFAPGKYQGRPVKVWAKQKVRFDFN